MVGLAVCEPLLRFGGKIESDFLTECYRLGSFDGAGGGGGGIRMYRESWVSLSNLT